MPLILLHHEGKDQELHSQGGGPRACWEWRCCTPKVGVQLGQDKLGVRVDAAAPPGGQTGKGEKSSTCMEMGGANGGRGGAWRSLEGGKESSASGQGQHCGKEEV